MLSSDKNVESLARLIETLKDYIGLQKEYLKFDVIDKLVRLCHRCGNAAGIAHHHLRLAQTADNPPTDQIHHRHTLEQVIN